MKYFFAFCCLLATATAFSQQEFKPAAQYKYFGLHGAGLLLGSSQQSLSLLTTNGITKNDWYAGITTGTDWYGLRSVPVLASLHKAFGKNKNQPFVYGNAGLSCPWEKPYSHERNSLSSAHYRNSFMGEVGAGYFISLRNKTALSLSVGYSYKTVRLKGTYSNIIYDYSGIYSYYSTDFENTYHYRRIAIRLGIKI